MSLFVLSDTHLSFGCDKPMDVFRGWENYHDRIRDNWNAVVGPEDTVVIPGDVSWAMDIADAKEDFAFLNSLPGKKIIGKGNHDFWWGTLKKNNEFIKANGFEDFSFLFNNAYETGEFAIAGSRGWFFDDESDNAEKVIMREAGRLKTSLDAALAFDKPIVLFMHYPLVWDSKRCEELLSVVKSYPVYRVYFGHIHGEKNGVFADFTADELRFSLVSADYLGFMPKKVM